MCQNCSLLNTYIILYTAIQVHIQSKSSASVKEEIRNGIIILKVHFALNYFKLTEI